MAVPSKMGVPYTGAGPWEMADLYASPLRQWLSLAAMGSGGAYPTLGESGFGAERKQPELVFRPRFGTVSDAGRGE